MLIELYGMHGRGIATACRILAEACASSNMHVQAMIVDGSEPTPGNDAYASKHTGVKTGYKSAFLKFDKQVADKVFDEPDFIVFFDNIELKNKVLKENSIVIYNSKERIDNSIYKKRKIKSHFVDAFSIAQKPNIVMLGALSKLCNKVSATSVKAVLKNYKMSAQDFDEGYRGVK